jgi:hypothetical protein
VQVRDPYSCDGLIGNLKIIAPIWISPLRQAQGRDFRNTEEAGKS